ncbi:bacterio-opsin activator domain-containing protein [Halegenticoccus soli]|uniref:bacterio-opsin activator domain-containing protein n=1 Tax=Halegenticoccus soli TaxID=1985678 RepID=UPI000C6CBA26|nr:helix-turn-helix domain-containing protein [Halegenticoccus soli]
MVTIADFLVPAEGFVLSDALSRTNDVRVTAEQVVTLSDARLSPYVRVDGADVDAFESALAADATITEIDRLQNGAEERFYRIEWGPSSAPFLSILDDGTDASVLSARSDGRNWKLRLIFDDRTDFIEFCRRCQRVTPLKLTRVTDGAISTPIGDYGLTTAQRQALLRALESGYFDVPRRTTQQGLADDLHLSSQSVSQRLRRGQRNLLQNTLGAHVFD